MANTIHVQVDGGDDIDQWLAQLPFDLRTKALPKALRAAGNVVNVAAREHIRDPGYPGDKAGLVPLQKTIITKVRRYDRAVVVIVGPHYLGGNHGHLVEFGHRLVYKVKKGTDAEEVKVSFVPPYPFMRPAAAETRDEQHEALITTLTEEIRNYQRARLGQWT